MEPYAIVHIRLEHMDDVLAWDVSRPAAYQGLLTAVEAGEFGSAKAA